MSVFVFLQDILEMNLSNFRIGGINITGFTLVNLAASSWKTLIAKWKDLDRKEWPGAGTEKVKVIQQFN